MISCSKKQSQVVDSDETGYRIGGQESWMWLWCNIQYAYLKVSVNHGYATMLEVLGKEDQPFVMVFVHLNIIFL
jgi:hypothetical protein